ncbi:MAG: glycosyltransferase family 4 protein [Pseudomonadota bacterium]
MRILFVNYEYPPLGGGGGLAMRSVAVELAKRHDVHVLTSGAHDQKREETEDGVQIFRAPVLLRSQRSVASVPSMLSFWPSGVRSARSSLGDLDFDLINSWFAVPSGPIGRHAARQFDVPQVLTLAGGDIYDPSKWYAPNRNPVLGHFVKGVLRAADRTVAVSSDVSNRAQLLYDYNEPIDVIPLGVDEPVATPVGRDVLGWDKNGIYIVSVGRLVKRKNLHVLIQALSKLSNQNVHLVIIGDGPQHHSLEDLARRKGIDARVHFTGFVPDTIRTQMLTNANVFALTSLHEAFGLVYVEAMHAGLPVIASQPGGQEDYLTQGKTGYLLPPEDIDGLVAALSRLVENPQLRAKMGAYNQKLAKSYSVAHTAVRYERLFEEILTQNAAQKAETFIT